MGCPEPGAPSSSPGGTEPWARARVGWGVPQGPHLRAQVQPSLAGSELSALLRLGPGGGTEEGKGEGEGASDEGGGWGCPATTKLPSYRCLGGTLKGPCRKAGPRRG